MTGLARSSPMPAARRGRCIRWCRNSQDLIEGDAHLYMRAHQMFTQIPKKAPYDKSPDRRAARCAITGVMLAAHDRRS